MYKLKNRENQSVTKQVHTSIYIYMYILQEKNYMNKK